MEENVCEETQLPKTRPHFPSNEGRANTNKTPVTYQMGEGFKGHRHTPIIGEGVGSGHSRKLVVGINFGTTFLEGNLATPITM